MRIKRDLSGRLARELATGKANLDRAPEATAIPTPQEDIASLTKSVRAMKNVVDTLTGASGSVAHKALTPYDLLDDALLEFTPSAGLVPFGGSLQFGTPGGGGGGSYDPTELGPYYATPPTPTNLTATGTLRVVILEWDLISYRNHAFIEVWRNTTNNQGSATLIAQATGNILVDPDVSYGTTYYYWVRAVNVQSTAGAFNNINGVSAAPGLVGNTDLANDAVTAAKIANGEISAAKLAAQAIELTKFANGIEPVSIVTGALPGAKTTAFIWRTDDSKLYRWDGSSYVSTVSGGDVTSGINAANVTVGQFTAGQIAAGAIGTTQLAANAVTTNKLLVTGGGANITPDPNTLDATAWTNVGAAGATFVVDTTSPTGYALRATGSGPTVVTQPAQPIDASKNYRLRMSVRQESGTSTTYLTVAFYDASGAPLSGAAGWPGSGTFQYFGLIGQVMPSTWTTYEIAFGPDETAKIPAAAQKIAVGFLANYNGTGVQRITGVRLVEKVGADLIVDGSVSATKLSAGSVIAGKLAANAIIAGDGVIGNAAIDDAKIANLSAAKVTFGTMSGDRIAANTLQVDRLVAGALSSDNVLTRGLTVRDGSGNVILSAGTNLDFSRINPSQQWLTTGQNLLANSDQTNKVTWALSYDPGNGATFGSPTLVHASTEWPTSTYALELGRLRNVVVFQSNRHSGAVDANSDGFGNTVARDFALDGYVPIVPGQKYAFSVYLASHRCRAAVFLAILDAANNSVAFPFGSIVGPTDNNANSLSLYARSQGNYTAPSNAVKAQIRVRKYNTVAGETNSYLWLAAPQIEAINADATGPSPYTPGPASDATHVFAGGKISASNISTYMSAAAIDLAYINTASIGSLSAITANLGSVDIATSGYLRSGQTAYDTGTGFWMGLDGGVPKMSLGSSTKGIFWNGTTFGIRGDVVATGNIQSEAVTKRYQANFTHALTVNGSFDETASRLDTMFSGSPLVPVNGAAHVALSASLYLNTRSTGWSGGDYSVQFAVDVLAYDGAVSQFVARFLHHCRYRLDGQDRFRIPVSMSGVADAGAFTPFTQLRLSIGAVQVWNPPYLGEVKIPCIDTASLVGHVSLVVLKV